MTQLGLAPAGATTTQLTRCPWEPGPCGLGSPPALRFRQQGLERC